MIRIVRKALLSSALLASLGLASVAAAAPVFFDDFNGTYADADYVTTAAFSTNLHGWSASAGNVDVLPANKAYSNLCQSLASSCIDLDGTNGGVPAELSNTATFTLQANTTYQITALIGGNRRGGGSDTVEFGVLAPGSSRYRETSVSIGGGELLVARLFNFVTDGANVEARVFFKNLGVDNNGAILQSVSISAVPLPAAVWLLLSGLGGMGLFARRRRTAAA